MPRQLTRAEQTRIIAISIISAATIYTWANLETSGPLGLRLFFTIGGVLTASLFQIDNFTQLAKSEEAITYCHAGSLALQTIPSTLSNLPLLFLALQGVDQYVSPFWLNIVLKVLASYGCVEEAFFGALGVSYLLVEFKRLYHGVLGTCSRGHAQRAAVLGFDDLKSELELFKVPTADLNEATEEAYVEAERSLPYHPLYHRSGNIMGMLLGLASACCYFYNAVEFMRATLIAWLPQHADSLKEPYTTAALWAANTYNVGFCTTYGNAGGRALFNKIWPLMVYGDKRDFFACTVALILATVSMGPAIEIARGANTFGAFNIFLCYLPGTLPFGYHLYDLMFGQRPSAATGRGYVSLEGGAAAAV